MAEPCLIRPAAEADLAAIVAIEHESFADPWSLASFRSLLSDLSLVAADGPTVVGYLFAGAATDVGEIYNVAVHTASRRRGIAQRLVAEACGLLAARGVEQVFLEVRESNAAARDLYDRLGFKLVGRRRDYYRRPQEDALILGRWLRPDGAPGSAVDGGSSG